MAFRTFSRRRIAGVALATALGTTATAEAGADCSAKSGDLRVGVVELYTSEGCSSCPPADRWLSTLGPQVRRGELVAQAFHVGYWDYIGWADRFAAPGHATRQRALAARTRSPTIYTPQVVRDGVDVRDYGRAFASGTGAASVRLSIRQSDGDRFEATVVPDDANRPWSAYWTVTEDGHVSRVTAGENAGESLRHDFVVRQYVPLGVRKGEARLPLVALPAQAAHDRRVNLVVFNPATGHTLQALGMRCGG